MKKYRIKIAAEALSDIRDITVWYDSQRAGLGKIFKDTVIKQINDLAETPLIFTVRYKEIRCMLVKKFPYMVHFYFNQKISTVEVWQLSALTEIPNYGKRKQVEFNLLYLLTQESLIKPSHHAIHQSIYRKSHL
ncbi:MAG: hypothetical protein K0M50_09425 [Prolixibacteraceae bacterium]|nr:hypothetical protein [Prolixibacteraceae bacterium]